MAALNIALLGACPVELLELAAPLEKAMHILDPHLQLTAASAACIPASLAGFELVLLAGVETRSPGQGKEKPDAAPEQEAAEKFIREALAGVSYRVLYGTTGERLAHALHAVDSLLPAATRSRPVTGPSGIKKQPWVWMCDKCSDPQCEHRLLTALLAGRDRTAGVQPTPAQPVRPY